MLCLGENIFIDENNNVFYRKNGKYYRSKDYFFVNGEIFSRDLFIYYCGNVYPKTEFYLENGELFIKDGRAVFGKVTFPKEGFFVKDGEYVKTPNGCFTFKGGRYSGFGHYIFAGKVYNFHKTYQFSDDMYLWNSKLFYLEQLYSGNEVVEDGDVDKFFFPPGVNFVDVVGKMTVVFYPYPLDHYRHWGGEFLIK